MSVPFQILGIDHIGFAPKDAHACLNFLHQTCGLPHTGQEQVPEQKVQVNMVQVPHTRLELLQPIHETGPIAAFLQKKGGGIHHIALRVDSIDQALRYLQQQGVEMVDKEPRIGAEGSQIAFVHPRSAGGILIELVQVATADAVL